MSKKPKYGSRVPNTYARGAISAEKALQLRAQRLTYAEIGQRLGVSGEAARLAVLREYDRLRASNLETAEEVRAQELESLDGLESRLLELALTGDVEDPHTLSCVDRILKIKERRARLLGLDVKGGIEIAAASSEMAVRIYVPDDGSGPGA